MEYAFDFMEIAFGVSQEMTIFITELNMNAYSVKFLQEYQCERYYQYNKQLVFDETDRNIRNRIERVEMPLRIYRTLPDIEYTYKRNLGGRKSC